MLSSVFLVDELLDIDIQLTADLIDLLIEDERVSVVHKGHSGAFNVVVALEVSLVLHLFEVFVERDLSAELRLMDHLKRDDVVVRVIAALLRENERLVVAAFFHEVVELRGILGETVLHVKLVLALLTDVLVDVLIVGFRSDAGAVGVDETFRVANRGVDDIGEVSLERSVELRSVDFRAELLEVGERFFRLRFAMKDATSLWIASGACARLTPVSETATSGMLATGLFSLAIESLM